MKLGVKIKESLTEVCLKSPLQQIFVIINNEAWICMSKEINSFHGQPTLMRA